MRHLYSVYAWFINTKDTFSYNFNAKLSLGSFGLALMVSVSACGGGSSGGASGGVNVNDGLSGDLWHEGGFGETYIFNFETGIDRKVSDFRLYPSRTGTTYLHHFPEIDSINPLESSCGERIDVSRVELRETRTSGILSSFITQDPITGPMKPSPDGSRLLAISNAHPCDQESRDPENVTMYSSNGELLIRFATNVSSAGFDWLPDGRAAVMLADGGRTFSLHIESAVGSLFFEQQAQWTFPDAAGGIGVTGLKFNHDGTRFLMELILDTSSVNTQNFRHSSVVLVDLIQSDLYSVFQGNEPDGSIKAAGPAFSPDGNWILTTHDYFTGAVILETNPSFALSSSGVSYVVIADSINQPMPPDQLSTTVRAVVRNGQQLVRINPLHLQQWTPTSNFQTQEWSCTGCE